MNPFTDRHASNLSLLFTAQKKQIRARVPAKADAFDKRIDDDFMSPMKRTLDVLYDLRTSTRYAKPRDEQRRYAYDFTKDRLTKLRADTVDALEAQRQKREAAVLTSKKTTSDPALALVQEMQRQEVRRELRTLDPLTLSVRLKQAAGTEAGDALLAAIESDPIAAAGGAPIVGADVLRDTRAAHALAADPALGELAMLRDAYKNSASARSNRRCLKQPA